MRPGVPTTTCTPRRSSAVFSLRAEPPTARSTLMPMKEPMPENTAAICVDSSRVGEIIRTCGTTIVGSTRASDPITNVPVLPVPDWACARISRRSENGLIASVWMRLGCVKPNE